MGISKRYLDTNPEPIHFSVDLLAASLQSELPEVIFACLLGSATDGVVKPHSDLDLAIYLSLDGLNASFNILGQVAGVVEQVVGAVRADTGMLNYAEPIYAFEALMGRLLFTRDQEVWLRFYSRTSRLYEHQLFDYERQWRYRMEARR